jgi:hypothetical protein
MTLDHLFGFRGEVNRHFLDEPNQFVAVKRNSNKRVWPYKKGMMFIPDVDAGSANRAAATCALNEHMPGERDPSRILVPIGGTRRPDWSVAWFPYAAWRGVIGRGIFFACAS